MDIKDNRIEASDQNIFALSLRNNRYITNEKYALRRCFPVRDVVGVCCGKTTLPRARIQRCIPI